MRAKNNEATTVKRMWSQAIQWKPKDEKIHQCLSEGRIVGDGKMEAPKSLVPFVAPIVGDGDKALKSLVPMALEKGVNPKSESPWLFFPGRFSDDLKAINQLCSMASFSAALLSLFVRRFKRSNYSMRCKAKYSRTSLDADWGGWSLPSWQRYSFTVSKLFLCKTKVFGETGSYLTAPRKDNMTNLYI